ncbi:DUF4169 family protein [Pelagibacterium mangrovi]|uniref:DUF4169 family protein n=1 Tax=Pelagibacterium mangrovi TaxID=3119828 RepID=UPI002FC93ADB
MAEIVNLRQARKAKARAQKERASEANRAKFGRTRAERDLESKISDKLDRDLDGHKRD